MERLTVIRECRSCLAPALVSVLPFGDLPLANSLVAASEVTAPEPRYPLTLAFCQACGLAQILETVSRETLFREYSYFSSYSNTLLAHARELAASLIASRGLGAASLVVEVASNDGYLLENYLRAGVPVLGIDPAGNVASAAEREHGVRTLTEFFDLDLARRLSKQGLRADVLHAHNVLAHTDDLNGFIAGLALLRKPGGVIVIEVPYVADLVAGCEFDTIYHEHLCYFSLATLKALLARHGLGIREAQHLPIQGGSLLLLVEDAGPGAEGGQPLLAAEEAVGVNTLEFYRGFADRVRERGESLQTMLRELRGRGKRIAGYGAAAKATQLLNVFGLGRELIDFVVDRSPHKQGRVIPGVRIPVLDPAELLARKPDYCLLLAWNLAAEIRAQQEEYERRGGRFILPLPEPRVL